ncbi:MAG: ABC-F family ATP-binding cassette domain-containing protein [bacterium]
MALVSLNDANFDYGREKILRGVNFALQPGVKVALVGANGAGKTTLLAAIAGELELPAGVRQTMGAVRIRMLRQDSSLETPGVPGAGLLETVATRAFARERDVEQELAAVARRLEQADASEHAELVRAQGRLQDEFERLDGYTMQSRLETALAGVGLPATFWDRPVDGLSGGERRRAALAVVLLSGADLLLLDEPTNHLDLESCEWLEGFLGSFPGAAVVVSHDREFLDRVARRTVHLDRGRLTSYTGNYSFFVEQSRLRHQQDFNAWQRQQARIKQTEEYIRRNLEGQNTKQAQSRRKQLAKEEIIERPSAEADLYRFRLEPGRPSGGTVLHTEGLRKTFGPRVVIDGLDLHVSRGERIGILGPNGCGKSTLLKMVAGRAIPDAGKLVLGHNVDLGYYDQELSNVADHNTVIGEMGAVDPRATLGELRSFLGAFGFGEDLFDREVGRLSGGERARLSLLRLIKEGHNTLLLDEPTNHLDVRSRESLEAALKEFDGTMIVVSHDRRFLDKLVQRLIVFGEDAGGVPIIQQYAGNYSEYARDRDERRAAAQAAAVPSRKAAQVSEARPVSTGGLSKNEIQRRQRRMDELEAQILALEEEKDAAVASMGRAETTAEQRVALGLRCQAIDGELQELMGAWEQLGLEIEES